MGIRMTSKVLAEDDLWSADAPAVAEGPGVYVAISGNTGAGKTTLINNVVSQARAKGHSVIGIGERSLHHPYLPRMFFDPERYAFPIQVNFMLQRHLVLLRQLERGCSVVIERSHFDDEMFVHEHVTAGRISPEQVVAYHGLAEVLHARIPAPHVLVLMNPDPTVSLQRLTKSEESGERPREFPDEDSKRKWVLRWHDMYRDLHKEFAQRCREDVRFSHTTLIHLDANLPSATNAAMVLKALLDHRGNQEKPDGPGFKVVV
jgi:deoxyadenosine/deoxycytidine kinase